MSPRLLDIIAVLAALSGALVSVRYYIAALLEKDRPLSRSAALAALGFCIAGAVYLWVFR